MKAAGHGPAYIFGVWGAIALASGEAAAVGNVALAGANPEFIAATTAVAAGAILAMLIDTMIPEAAEFSLEFAGLITVAGLLDTFVLSKLGG